MARRQLRRSVAVACLLASTGTGCTPSSPPTPPSSTASSTPSPTATATETAQEREERLAYEAAEKNYRAFRVEYNRVLARGGEAKPTAKMLDYAGGPYLEELQAGSAAYRGLRHHSRGVEKIVYVRRDGFETKELVLHICEDSRGVTTLDAKNNKLYTGDLRELSLVFRLRADSWKAWTGSGKQVKACS